MADQLQWLSADQRQAIILTDASAGYRVLADATTGLNAPPYRIGTTAYAGIDGLTVQSVTADARDITLGLLIQAQDEQAFRLRSSVLTRAMRPKVGPGTLIASDASGRTRRITCFYTGGLDGDEARSVKLPGRWWKTVIHLLAPDPWWYGEPQSISIGLGAPVPFFPIPPVKLSSSTVQGQFTVDLSDADDPAYPVWTITGPGTSLVLTNVTTGRVIAVNAALAAGEQMIIDTRPGFQSVRRGSSASLMGSLNSDPAMWALVEDINQVSAQLTGATAASRISGIYSPRYAGI